MGKTLNSDKVIVKETDVVALQGFCSLALTLKFKSLPSVFDKFPEKYHYL